MFPTQYKCPVGTWSSQSGLEAEAECQPCPRGWYCLAGSAAPSGRCNSGHYCPEGKQVQVEGTERKVVGFFSVWLWKFLRLYVNDKLANCHLNIFTTYCKHFTHAVVMSHSFGYNYGDVAFSGTAYGTQYPCPAGTYSIQMGNRYREDCLTCPEGSFCQLGTSKPSPCPPCVNRTSEIRYVLFDKRMKQVLKLWFGNYVCSVTLSSSFRRLKGGRRLEDCSPCPAGYFCPYSATINPRVCGAGSYSVRPH